MYVCNRGRDASVKSDDCCGIEGAYDTHFDNLNVSYAGPGPWCMNVLFIPNVHAITTAVLYGHVYRKAS